MTGRSALGEDRRNHPRQAAILAVGLESERRRQRLGVTRDLSTRGLLIVTPSRFSKGDRLKLTVHTGAGEINVFGRVAHVDEHPVSSPELWRYRVGIALDEALPPAILDEAAAGNERWSLSLA